MFYICCQSIDHIDPLWDIRVCTSCFTFVVNQSIILTHYGIQGYVHHVLHLLSINRSYWPIMGHKGMYIMFYICCQCRSYWPIMGYKGMYIMFYICCQSIDHIDPLWDIRVCTSCFTFVVNPILTHYGIQGYVHHVLHLLSMNRSYWPIMGHKGMYIMFYICCQSIDHIDPLWDIRVCTSCFTFVVNESIILTHYGT